MSGFKIDLSIEDAEEALEPLLRLGLDLGRLEGAPRIEIVPSEEPGWSRRQRSLEVLVMFDDPTAAANALGRLRELNVIEPGGALRSSEAIDADIVPLPPADHLPISVREMLETDNALLRREFLARFPSVLTPDSSLRRKEKVSRTAAARWKRDGAIFSIHHDGIEHIPAFQFKQGRPYPSIKKVLDALPTWFSDWQRAFWFVSTNGWLDDDAPTDRLEDGDALVAAAKHEAEELAG